MSVRCESDAKETIAAKGQNRRLRVVLLGVVLIAATTTWKASWASTSTPGASECTTVTGTAKTASLVNLSATTPQSAGVVFALNATGCTVPRVDAQATNGPATQAALAGTLKSPSARCVLSTSGERPWGQLTVKWKNAAGAALLNSAGKPIKDQLFVRLDPDGSERYDLHGFGTSGPDGGGDVSAEIGLQRLAACGTAPTKWSVISDGTIVQASAPGSKDPGVSEVIGGDGDTDDFVIERFSTSAAVPTSTTAPSTSTTTTTLPAIHATVAQICGSSSDGVAVDTLSGQIVVFGDTTPTTYGQLSVAFDTAAIQGTRPGCVDTDWTPPPPDLVAYCQFHLSDPICVTAIEAFAIRTHVAAPGYEAKLDAFGTCALTTSTPAQLTACVDAR
jgi:hypothetical protein